MYLRLNYEKLLNQKILNYIDSVLASSIVGLIAKLFSDFRKAQNKIKQAENEFEQEPDDEDEYEDNPEEEEEDESFIDNDNSEEYVSERKNKRMREKRLE